MPSKIANLSELENVLCDSVNDYMIKSIRGIKNGAMHVLGMCKIDKRKYSIDKKELNSSQGNHKIRP